jgi:hypothetical protein
MAARIVASVDPARLARPDRQPDLARPPDHRHRRWRSRRRHRHRRVPRHLPRARRRGRGPAGAVAVRPRGQSLVLPRHGVTRGLRTAAPIPQRSVCCRRRRRVLRRAACRAPLPAADRSTAQRGNPRRPGNRRHRNPQGAGSALSGTEACHAFTASRASPSTTGPRQDARSQILRSTTAASSSKCGSGAWALARVAYAT